MAKKYQASISITLPKDPPFRDKPLHTKRDVLADDAQELWQNVTGDLTKLLGFGFDANLLVGLLLNTINSMPTSIREGMVAGIVQGSGLTLVTKDGELMADMSPKFPPLELRQEEPVEGVIQRKSGLVIPA